MEVKVYIPHPALQDCVLNISTVNAVLPGGIEDAVTPYPPTPFQSLMFYCNKAVSMSRTAGNFETQPLCVLVGPQFSRVNVKVHGYISAVRVDFLPGGHERLVIAAEDNDFWRSYLPPISQLPPPIAAQITKAYRKPDSSFSMMPFFDLLALHEMGHSYTAQAGLKMHRYWMNELFVNIMLHTYVAEKQPELLPALEAFPNMVVGAGTVDYKFTSLEDFEKLYTTIGMGPKNYGWYQCKLHTAAKDIYNAGGKQVLNRLWQALKKHQDKMSDEEFVNMLEKDVHPSVADVYLNWDKLL